MTALLVVVVGLIAAGCLWAWRHEAEQWNGGICPDTGKPWERRDTDSQGGRMYVSGPRTIWISWPVDR